MVKMPIDDSKHLDDGKIFQNGLTKREIFDGVMERIRVITHRIRAGVISGGRWVDDQLRSDVEAAYERVYRQLEESYGNIETNRIDAMDIVLGMYATYQDVEGRTGKGILREYPRGTYGKVHSILEDIVNDPDAGPRRDIRESYLNGDITLQEVVDGIQDEMRSGKTLPLIDELVARTGHEPRDLENLAKLMEEATTVLHEDAQSFLGGLFPGIFGPRKKSRLTNVKEAVIDGGFNEATVGNILQQVLNMPNGFTQRQLQTLAHINHVIMYRTSTSEVSKAKNQYQYLVAQFATPSAVRQFTQAHKGLVYTSVLFNLSTLEVVFVSSLASRFNTFVSHLVQAVTSVKKLRLLVDGIKYAWENNLFNAEDALAILQGSGIDTIDVEEEVIESMERAKEFSHRNLHRILEGLRKIQDGESTVLTKAKLAKDLAVHITTHGGSIVGLVDYLQNAFAIPYGLHRGIYMNMLDADATKTYNEITSGVREILLDNNALQKEIDYEIEVRGLTGAAADKYRKMRAKQLSFDFVDIHTKQYAMIRAHRDSVTGTYTGHIGRALAKIQKAFRESFLTTKSDAGLVAGSVVFTVMAGTGVLFSSLIATGSTVIIENTPIGLFPLVRGKARQIWNGYTKKGRTIRVRDENGSIVEREATQDDFYYINVVDKKTAQFHKHVLDSWEKREMVTRALMGPVYGLAVMLAYEAVNEARWGDDDDEDEQPEGVEGEDGPEMGERPKHLYTNGMAYRLEFRDENGQKLKPFSSYVLTKDGRYRFTGTYKDRPTGIVQAMIAERQYQKYFTETGHEGLDMDDALVGQLLASYQFFLQYGPSQITDFLETSSALISPDEEDKMGVGSRVVQNIVRTHTPLYGAAKSVEAIRSSDGLRDADDFIGNILDETAYNYFFETKEAKELGIRKFPTIWNAPSSALFKERQELTEDEQTIVDVTNRFPRYSQTLRKFFSDKDQYESDSKIFIEYNYTQEEREVFADLASDIKGQLIVAYKEVLLNEPEDTYADILSRINRVSNDLVKTVAIARRAGKNDKNLASIADELEPLVDDPSRIDLMKYGRQKPAIYDYLKAYNLMITDDWEVVDKDTHKRWTERNADFFDFWGD